MFEIELRMIGIVIENVSGCTDDSCKTPDELCLHIHVLPSFVCTNAAYALKTFKYTCIFLMKKEIHIKHSKEYPYVVSLSVRIYIFIYRVSIVIGVAKTL